MLSLDLFDSQYERELREGAVDNLEARRIDDLNMRMLELLDRAKEPAYRKNPGALEGLKRQFQKIKAERDSYFKINPATGMNADQTLGTTKGKLDEVDPPQRAPARGLLKNKDLVTPQQRVAGATPARPGITGAVKDVAGGLKRWIKGEPDQGPTYEDQQIKQSPRAYGVANFQRLVKANMGGYPTVTLEFGPNIATDQIKLDQRGLDLVSDYYDGLANDSQKNHFIYRVLPSQDETLTVLKKLGWSQQVQQELPGVPTQGELPLSEKQNQKKNSEQDNIQAGDVKTAREIQKIRAQYPAAHSDIEALARAELDSTERSQQQIGNIRSANSKQDELLKQIMDIDREQSREIGNLDNENDSLEQQLNRVQSLNAKLSQALNQNPVAKSTRKPSKSQTAATTSGTINLIPGAPADKQTTATQPTPNRATSEPVEKPTRTTSPAIANMARQITGFQSQAPAIDKKDADDTDATDELPIEKPVSMKSLRPTQATNREEFKLVGEHGGGIGPKKHWQSMMPEQSDDDWYDDDEEDQDTELRSGDYVRDTMDGKHGEVFRMQGDPYERRVQILDRDGKGWYIEPSRLTRVDPADPDVQRYFGKKRQRDMDEQEQKPGFGEFPPKQEITIVPPKKLKSGETYQDRNKYWQSQGQAPIYKTNEDNDQVKRVFKDKAGKPVGEIGIDPESSPGNGEWYVHHYATGYSVVGFDSAAEAKRELLYVNKHPDAVEGHPSTKEQGVAESAKPGEYYIHTVYFKDGTKKRIRVTSDEFDVADYYTKRGQAVDRVDYDFQLHSEKLLEGIKDTASATAVIACLLTGGSLTGCATAPQQTSAQQVLKTGQDIGRTVQTAKNITRAGTEAEVQQELRNILRGISGRPEELNHSNIIRIWRRINQPNPQQNEAREIVSKEDFIRERDRLLRMISQETNPANKQILKSAIRQLENRAENEKWITIQNRMMREDSDNEAVERAILNRIMVAHTDLLMKFGPDKVMQAAEEVAYNVGDVDEIGTSDVSAYVAQVKQILGATS